MKPNRLSLLLAGCLLAASFQLHAATAPEDDAGWSLGAVVDVRDAGSDGARECFVTLTS